jgi:ferredoxin/flavodoxin---NADP+ reductase
MTAPGTTDLPLRVAVVGSGPAGFYVAEHLLNREGLTVQVDMYERLPAPYGLVRYGVAPDHEKIRTVTKTFDKKAGANPSFRFFGNVDVGVDVTLDQLRDHYHQICFASGAQTDRQMGIPGEDLERSHPATEFVAWYNGHPDYRDRVFDLSVERVAIVGVGNVAVDVARILCRTQDELATTDIADHALEALAKSNVKEVYMLGRRGPTQAAFTNPEVRELGQLAGANVAVRADEVALDPLSRRTLEANPDRTIQKKLEILEGFVHAEPDPSKSRTLTIRFLVSPVELVGNAQGQVCSMKLVRNALVERDNGTLAPRATDQFEDLPVDMVFRSVGYRGVPITGLPFDHKRGVVPNDAGRVIDPATGQPLPGVYVSGWIKRGPSGVIGTNKPDALETVDSMVADATATRCLTPTDPDRNAAEQTVRARKPEFVSYAAWRRLDEVETARGAAAGRPRVKFTTIEEALAAIRTSGDRSP